MKLAEDLRRAVLQAAIEGKLTGGSRDNWRFVRLGTISLFIQYGYNAPAREEGTVKMIRITDIQNNNVQWDNVPYCEISEEEMQKYLLAKNDILFARTGGTVGKSYLVDNMPEKAIYAGYLIRMRLRDEANPQYVKYFMESESYWKQLRNGTTATAQPNCNGKTLSQMIIPLPPIEEQRRIVSRLDAILPLIAELESAENELAELERRFPGDMRDSLLQAAIEGRLTGSNTDNWRWVRLGEISLSIQYGYNAPAREKGSVKMVRISDIQNNNIQWDNVPYCEISEEEMQKYLLSKNDILFARTGSVGKSYLVGDLPEVAIYAGYLIRVRISDEVNPRYIKYFMESESYWKQIRKGTTKTVQPNCNGKKLSQIIIPLPPIDEQHKIAARLNELLPLCEAMKGE